MADNGKKKPPLVADKRYSSSSNKKKKPTKAAPKPKAKPRKAARTKAKRTPSRKLPWIIALPLGIIRWAFRIVFRLGLATAVIAALLLGAAVFYTSTTIPPLTELVDGRAEGSVTMIDRNGETYAWRGDQYGGLITTDTVSEHLTNAVIASEDRRFYSHFGVSPRGIASAVRINLREGRGPLSGHGGSTLTQQVAKLVCLGVPYDPNTGMTEAEYEADCREGSVRRKAKEAIYAMAMEVKFSKDEILTIYLNRAYMGEGSYGFEAASRRYFDLSTSEIGPGEAAMLAGLLPKPSYYAPTRNFQISWDRALTVLRLMEDQARISEADAAYARANPPILARSAAKSTGGYFANWVMNSGPAFLTRDTTEDVIIRTTFDPAIQQAAEEALDFVFENKVKEGSDAEAAIVVMDADGAVRAMVGGRSGSFNRATQAMRQTGSAFKPFIYAAALDLGYKFDDVIVDEPITINVPGSGPWSPQNYTRQFYGPVTLTTALKNSLNIPAVKLSEAVGRENVRTVASFFGIESDLAAGPALALGVSETTLLQMTGAFAGILNGGSAVTPYGLIDLRLMGESTPIMEQEGGIGKRVIQEGAAQQLVYMMNQVIETGTGGRARIEGREAAGKTGTTQSARDAWFVGFTADYVVGVWMGRDNNEPLTGVTGGGLPAEIWHETMTRISADLPARPLPMIRPVSEPQVAESVEEFPELFGPEGIFSRNNNGNRNNQGNNRRNNQPREDSLIGVIQNILGIN